MAAWFILCLGAYFYFFAAFAFATGDGNVLLRELAKTSDARMVQRQNLAAGFHGSMGYIVWLLACEDAATTRYRYHATWQCHAGMLYAVWTLDPSIAAVLFSLRFSVSHNDYVDARHLVVPILSPALHRISGSG